MAFIFGELMKKTYIVIFALLPALITAQSRAADQRSMERRAYVFDRYAPPYEVGRAMLPGLLCFIGAAMPDTKRGRAVQTGLFFGAGVAVGGWQNTSKKHKLIYVGCAIAGAAAGFIVRHNTK